MGNVFENIQDWLVAVDMGIHTNPRQVRNQKKVTGIHKKRVVSNYPIPHTYNDFRDYMSTYQLYLPYSNGLTLNASDIVGKSLSIDCYVDVRTGDIKYNIWLNTTIIASVSGHCRVNLPITRIDKDSNGLQAVSNIGQGIVTTTTGALMGGGVGAVVGAVTGIASGTLSTASQFNKPNPLTIQGGFGGGCSVDDPLGVYLIEYRPHIERPQSLITKYGLPCHKVDTIGNNTGYVKLSDCAVQGLATEEEKQMIRGALLSGCYI